jgi:DNA-binding MarR family transcriptional regulator
MATEQDNAAAPTPREATRALTDIEARRALVRTECRRHLPLQLAFSSTASLIDYAAKDLTTSRWRRSAVTALCLLTGIGMWAIDQPRVEPWLRRDERFESGLGCLLVAGVAAAVIPAERLLLRALRHSGLRRPNTIAGIVFAITRPATTLLLNRRLLGDHPKGAPLEELRAARLNQLLLEPTRLTIAAVLAASLQVELGFLGEATQLTDTTLSKQLRTLTDGELVALEHKWVGPRRRTWARLTDPGRELFTAHVAALREIANQAPGALSRTGR